MKVKKISMLVQERLTPKAESMAASFQGEQQGGSKP